MGYPPDQTWLSIQGIPGIPRFSAFNCEQTYDYIEAAKNNERDLNGHAIDLSRPEMHKYSTTIRCHDVFTPLAMDGIFPGAQLVIDCVTPMLYPVGGTPDRPVVPGSESPSVDGLFVIYLPRLTCLLDDYTPNYDEWGARAGWTLKASEV